MQGTPGEYFWNCWYLAQPLKSTPLLLVIFVKDLFLNGEKMRKRKGQCRGYSHMRGTPGEYFWKFLYVAQPLKRQPPLLPVNSCERFFFKWHKNAKKKRMMQGAHSHAGDPWGIFWELFEFCTATQKATPPFYQ